MLFRETLWSANMFAFALLIFIRKQYFSNTFRFSDAIERF